MKILLIEDDAETAAYIVRGLHEHGHVADHVVDGQDGLLMAVAGAHVSWWTACCQASTGWAWSEPCVPPG